MKSKCLIFIFILSLISSQGFAQTPKHLDSPANYSIKNHNTSSSISTRHVWGDADNDGLQDILVLGGDQTLFYRNLGDGTFENVTSFSFPDGIGQGISGAWGDYNQDGMEDLFLMLSDRFAIFRNDGNLLFNEVTMELGLNPDIYGREISLIHCRRRRFNLNRCLFHE